MMRAAGAHPFLDTSALLKRYVAETGSDAVRRVLEAAEEIVVSPVTRLEVASAVARRRREGSLTGAEAARILRLLDREWRDFTRVRFGPELERAARRLLFRTPLRTLDAIQLASARLAKCRLLVASDERLLRAAERERLRTEAV
jgi:hypothetical protein